MGTPDFAVPTLKAIHASPHQLVAVVTIPDRPSGRGLKTHPSEVKVAATELGYPILQPDSLKTSEFVGHIKDCFPDIIVVVAFQILPPSVYEIPKFGAVNVHASLLPKYRGAAPIHRAILNGETETGVTTFQIAKKVDTGGVLLQKKTTIGNNETCGELWKKLSLLGAELIIPTLDGLDSDAILIIAQDNSNATSARKIDKSEYLIHWNLTSEKIHNQIRAFSPQPGAYTFLGDQRVKLFDSEIVSEEGYQLAPGKIESQKNVFHIGTGNGVIAIRSIQISGKQRMSISQFLNGYTVEEGQDFHE